MKTAVVIPAAGMGTRMGAIKQLLMLGSKPVLVHTLEAFENHGEVDEMVVVASQDVAAVILPYGFEKLTAVVEGGLDRQASVWAGLMALSPDVDNVLIHDGARPLVTRQAISDVIACVRQGCCAISGVKTKDTIKIADDGHIVKDTPNREHVWLVQTPQGFPYSIIKKAHQQAIADGFTGTDDAMLAERLGIPVRMIEGDYCNIKITTPEDMKIAENLLHMR
ncbi:MAG: 2-C-methyl-D-erythritol 4-phosphate cytidylyltransferase [Defluviitaleaceae bacterium]|nr:2-C-methyl-D-erythritol 4-phosphate cytidylyltransferase [Defluviitaleaceae bacterium]